jgi:hypothetical protein
VDYPVYHLARQRLARHLSVTDKRSDGAFDGMTG